MNRIQSKGQHYENLAKTYLLERGLSLLTQNYHCRFGEIDLIMCDQEVLCFIEVKFRKSLAFGGAASAISRQKQKKIVQSALAFISENRKLAHRAMRFDALLVQQQENHDHSVNWIQSAFYAE
jgi:putative endonuclease